MMTRLASRDDLSRAILATPRPKGISRARWESLAPDIWDAWPIWNTVDERPEGTGDLVIVALIEAGYRIEFVGHPTLAASDPMRPEGAIYPKGTRGSPIMADKVGTITYQRHHGINGIRWRQFIEPVQDAAWKDVEALRAIAERFRDVWRVEKPR